MRFVVRKLANICMSSLVAVLFASAVHAQDECSDSHEFAAIINEPFVICDEQNDWVRFKRTGDFISVTAKLENNITAFIEVDLSAGVENQATAYRFWESSTRTAAIDNLGAERTLQFTETLTKISGYPAFTYVYNDRLSGQDVVRADTVLLLFEKTIRARTVQISDAYSPEHASQHAEILSKITYDWDM